MWERFDTSYDSNHNLYTHFIVARGIWFVVWMTKEWMFSFLIYSNKQHVSFLSLNQAFKHLRQIYSVDDKIDLNGIHAWKELAWSVILPIIYSIKLLQTVPLRKRNVILKSTAKETCLRAIWISCDLTVNEN